jgi:MFS family permease
LGNNTQGIWLAQIPVIYVCSIGPTISQASDLWGRRWFLTYMTMFGLVGCMIIATASSWSIVIGGQIINAVAFAVSPVLYAVVSEITPRKYRGLAQSGLTIGNGVGAIFCLIFGEWLVHHSANGWRTFFYIIGAVQGVAAIVFGVFYRPPPRQLQLSLTLTEKLRNVCPEFWTASVSSNREN